MDDGTIAKALEAGAVYAAGSKRPCPSDPNPDGDIGNPYTYNRQRPAMPCDLSLLARCASNRENPGTDNSQVLVGGQDQQFQFPLGAMGTAAPCQHSVTNTITLQTGLAPNTQQQQGDIAQNISMIHGMNHAMNQIAFMQPNKTMQQGQSQSPAMLNPHCMNPVVQAQPTDANGMPLRPFGMTPQELLNYAILVNIIQKTTSQGNVAMSNLAFNCSQAMIQASNPPQAGGICPSQQGCNIADPNRTHQETLHNNFQAAYNNLNCAASVDPGQVAGYLNTQHQGCNESLQLATPNLITPNNGVQATNNPNGVVVGAPTNIAVSYPTNEAYKDNINDNMSHAISSDGSTQSVNTGAGTQFISNTNDEVMALPSHIIQAQQVIPNRRCVPLWTSEDDQCLSTQQCWLRKQICSFPASSRDVRARGRNRLLDLGQVGIQCIHCQNLPQEGRGKGSSYFPASIKSIYQSAQNMLTFHFKEDTCPLIPRRLLQEMSDAGEASTISPRMAPKAGKSRTGGGKSFWEASAATVTGLVDTTVGIRYSNDVQNYHPLTSIALGESESDESDISDSCWADSSVLTRIEDKGKVTNFCFILMKSFIPYCSQVSSIGVLTEGDEWESDIYNGDPMPSIGIVCRFCKGVSSDGKQSKGIFLSSKADTMMRNKNLARMYNHLLVCGPEDHKTRLMQAKNIHLPQSDSLKKGWKKQWFEKVCDRLHAHVSAEWDDSSSD